MNEDESPALPLTPRQARAQERAHTFMVAQHIRARGITDPVLLAAFARVPREVFVPASLRNLAYADRPLPIGYGQTISQPFVVAWMCALLDLPGWSRTHAGQVPVILDVGTGSGYQAAILAAMGAHVVTIERCAPLASAAQERLHALGYDDRITYLVGDGSAGHAPLAPYAGIVVGAASPGVPAPLTEQLADGGHLLLPVKTGFWGQELMCVTRVGATFNGERLGDVIFVPLIGTYGFSA